MSTDTTPSSARVPAGVPTGGQFAASAKTEAGVSLAKATGRREQPDFPRDADDAIDVTKAIEQGYVTGFETTRYAEPKTKTLVGHWDGNTIVVEDVYDGEVSDEREDTGHWSEGLWCSSGTGHSEAEIAAGMLDEYEESDDIRVALYEDDYTPGEDDEDEDEYVHECGHCGTYVSELGMDATGSRRCDDLDPDHRFHEPLND